MSTVIQGLLFSLKQELFGISVEHVLRVINPEKIMRIPKAPDFIVGAINLEGNVIPVADLAKKIDLGITDQIEKCKIIILEMVHDDEPFQVGVLIDEVIDVVTMESSKLLPPPLENMGFDTYTLDGMLKVEEDFHMIINPGKVFEKELAVLA